MRLDLILNIFGNHYIYKCEKDGYNFLFVKMELRLQEILIINELL